MTDKQQERERKSGGRTPLPVFILDSSLIVGN